MTRWHRFAFAAVALDYIATRALALRQAGSFWFDEAFSTHFAAMPLRQMWMMLQYEHNPLLHFLLLKGWMLLFGNTEIAARLLSAVLGCLAVFAIYLLGKRLYGASAGIFAAFLMSASTLMLYHQTEARMYALEVLLAVLVVYFAWIIRENKGVSNARIAVYALTGILLAHTHITAWALIAGLAFYWLLEQASGLLDARRFKALVYAHAAIILAVLPWLIPVARNKWAAGSISQGWFFSQNADGYFLTHLANMLVNGESGLLIRAATAFLMLCLLAAAFITVERPDWWQKVKNMFSRETWPIGLTIRMDAPSRFLLTLLFAQALIGFALQITVTKYLLTASIPLFLLMARGWQSISSKRVKALAVLCVIAVVLPMHIRLYTQQRHHWREAAAQVASWQADNPEAPVLVHSYAHTLLLQRYLDEPNASRLLPFYPREDGLSLDERIVRYNWQAIVNETNIDSLEAVLRGHDLVMLVSSTPASGEQDPVKKWLWTKGWTLEQIMPYKGYGDPELLVLRRSR